MEQQFDLECYEDQGEVIDMEQVKETDILSDDDEYCESVRAASAEPPELEGKMEGLGLQDGEMRSHNLNGHLEPRSEMVHSVTQEDRIKRGDDSDSFTSCGASLSRCATPTVKRAPLKQCAVEGATSMDHEVIWVRRDDFSNGCNSDVF